MKNKHCVSALILLFFALTILFSGHAQAATNVIRNGSFNDGLNEWVLSPPLVATSSWPLQGNAVKVNLNPPSGSFIGTVISQTLNVWGIGGKIFTLSMNLTKNYHPTGKTIAVYLTYIDSEAGSQKVLVLNPDNDAITTDNSGTPFTTTYLFTQTAQTLTGIEIAKEANGEFLVDDIVLSYEGTLAAFPGACGSSGGQVFVSNPTSNLCSAGTASVAVGTGPWSWSCTGSNGGATAQCNAGVLATIPSISGGTYNGAQTVTLTAGAGSKIYYTLDGTTPTTLSTLYSGPIIMNTTTTLKYFGVDSAGFSESVKTITYTIDYTLTTATAGSGSGMVMSNPAGIACGTDCSEVYPSGTAVTLTANPAAGSNFTGWSGACTGKDTCTFTVNENLTAIASFVLKGDINNDEAVTLMDAILALQVVSGVTPATSLSKLGNVNSDEKIGLAEVIYILQKIAGIRQN